MDWLLLIAGLVVLLAGGEALVRGATALAQRLGVSPLVIGMTVLAFGTSAPIFTFIVARRGPRRRSPPVWCGSCRTAALARR